MLKTDWLAGTRVRQGDVIKDVDFVEYVAHESGQFEVGYIRYPYVYVLSQDCDLEQHNKIVGSAEEQQSQDKILISVLVAPLYNAAHVFEGTHLVQLGFAMTPIKEKRSTGETLKNNSNPRYHYLEFPEDTGVIPSIIDFKHFFTVPAGRLLELRRTGLACSVSQLYREDISQRFAAYLSRIGLP